MSVVEMPLSQAPTSPAHPAAQPTAPVDGDSLATLQSRNPMRIGLVLGLPLCGRAVAPEWAFALRMLDFPTNLSVVYMPCKGKPVDEARELIAADALQQNARYLAFLDDDTIPPQNWVRRAMAILDQFPEAAAVGAIYPTKSDPAEPLVYLEECGGPFWQWKYGEIFRCNSIGTGAMMIRVDALRKIPRPWFRTIDEGIAEGTKLHGASVCKNLVSDDMYFCRKVNEAGLVIMADGGSVCGHADVATGRIHVLPPDSYPFRDERVARAMFIPGWMTPRELSQLADWAREHRTIVEVGSHVGRSTRALADNTAGTVIAFDDWQGPRDLSGRDSERVPADCEGAFRFNLKDHLESGKVRMVKGDHAQPEQVSAQPDMVFLDGSHDYAQFKRDLAYWMTALADGGLLCGHDSDWPGVQQALNELLPGSVKLVDGTTLWYAQSDKEGK